MATELSRGSLFDPKLVTDLMNKVKGHSSLAKLSKNQPIPFNGTKEFIFTMDNEIDVVAENGKKTHGGMDVEPVMVIPIKVEYGARVSDEFLYATEEEKINILKAFNEGYAKKVARGLDIMAFHGFNPRTKTASSVIGNNHFDSKVTTTITFDAAKANENIEDAIAPITAEEETVSGIAMSPAMRSALAKLKKSNGDPLFPELAWGSTPDTMNGLQVDTNSTVSFATSKDQAILGDFENGFKWGYAKEIAMEVIKYGDPDNSGKDLKGYNQVYIRAETYIGWGIMNPESFSRIVTAAA